MKRDGRPITVSDAKNHWNLWTRHVLYDSVRLEIKGKKRMWFNADGQVFLAAGDWLFRFRGLAGAGIACESFAAETLYKGESL